MKENDYIEKKVNISNGDNRIANKYNVFPHQKAAHEALDKALLKYEQNGEFSGLLVIPTGGGKTFTAVEWLLKNWLNHKRKILWIAHRQALLDQAKETFEKNCYINLVDKRTNLNFLTISGSPDHHKIKHISTDDDVVMITNLSLTQKKLKTFYDKWLEKEIELCVVIDEAHHTTAKTYQDILNFVKTEVKKYFILGLTATPIRTNENEEKKLMKIYKDGFIYEIGLKNLVISGILSEPRFINVDTGWKIGNEFSEKDIAKINKEGEKSAVLADVLNKIKEKQERNELIVKHYIENIDKYGQLLVFAANIEHARLLSALFNKYFEEKLINNIKADYIVSNEKGEENLTLKQTNKDKLENFRRGKTQILVNVQILTEGTDLPNVQSVFITHPIKSKTLLTQMVGRALRGSKMGGTEVANIILFIDNWEDKVLWETPETIGLQEKSPYENFFKKIPSKKQPTWFVPINELNKIVAAYYYEQKIDLKWLDFIERIPIGIYACSEIDDELGNQDTILVFSHLEHIYARFIQDLDYIAKLHEKIYSPQWQGVSCEFLLNFSLEILSEKVESDYFNHGKVYFGYSQKDVRNVLKHFLETLEKPQFIPFETRKKYDLDKLITENGIKQRFSDETINSFIDQKWNEEGHIWKAFFGYNKDFFSKEIFHILEKNTIKISDRMNNLKDVLGCDQLIGKYQHSLGELDFLDSPESLYERGVSYYKNGQIDEAILYLNAYLLQPIGNESTNGSAGDLLLHCSRIAKIRERLHEKEITKFFTEEDIAEYQAREDLYEQLTEDYPSLEEMVEFFLFTNIIFKSSVENDLQELGLPYVVIVDEIYGAIKYVQSDEIQGVYQKMYYLNKERVYYLNKEIFYVSYIYDFLIEKRGANTFVIYAIEI